MEKISIIFSTSTKKFNLFSRLIMWAEGSPYSHVAIRMDDNELDTYVIYQASHTIVNEMSEEQFLEQEIIIDEFWFDVDDRLKLIAKRFAVNNLGKPYGVFSILGLGLVYLCKAFRIKINNPFREAGKTYVCSQFVAALLNRTTNVILDEDINDITPKDLYKIVKSLPKVWLYDGTTQ